MNFVESLTEAPFFQIPLRGRGCRFFAPVFSIYNITETAPYKIYPRFARNIYVKKGKPWVGIENDKHSLFLNIFDKTCKIFLFNTCLKFVLYSTITFNMKLLS